MSNAVSIGDTLKFTQGSDNRLLHVIAIIENQIVYKWWKRRWSCWEYGIACSEYFQMFLAQGKMILKKSKNK